MRQAGHKPGQEVREYKAKEKYRKDDNHGINKLKEARLAAGLTQKSMSEKTGIPMRTIGDWETGHRRPSDWVAALVIEKLNRIKQENAAAK